MIQLASIILPAHNEAGYITACLAAVAASGPLPAGWRGEILVVANGCSDDTVQMAQAAPQADDWPVRVIDLPDGGKLGALNRGDAEAGGDSLIYLDADVIVSPGLLPALVTALDYQGPRYASGLPHVAPAQSWITRTYGRFWSRLPFAHQGVPGFGIFAMTRAGRARWGPWPDIISDDTYARLNFAPGERVGVEQAYSWPMVEGFANLVRVRRRQNIGVEEVRRLFPDLMQQDDQRRTSPAQVIGLFLRDPVGFCVYAAVAIAVKTPLFRSKSRWARGR